LNEHFVASFQKVATFRKVGGQTQGGNVASYFCTADGEVLHVVPGPVDGATLLREARWVVDTWRLAQLQCREAETDLPSKKFLRRAHLERLAREYGVTLHLRYQSLTYPKPDQLHRLARNPMWNGSGRGLNIRGQAHLLLARYPLVGVEKIYQVIFEEFLGEMISTTPVEEVRG
jgi:hypothetical protein